MSDFDDAIRAIAKARKMSVEEVQNELLQGALGGAPPPPAHHEPVPSRAIARSGSGDASGAAVARTRAEAVERHQSQSFPGSPVVRYQDEPESAEEAMERWYEEEAELPDGVHGLGGQTAGGIFGDGAIATSIYDPAAMGRTDQRVGQKANIKMLSLLERIEARLDASEQPRGALPGRAAPALPRGRRPRE